jgi:hypothetical protein
MVFLHHAGFSYHAIFTTADVPMGYARGWGVDPSWLQLGIHFKPLELFVNRLHTHGSIVKLVPLR